MSQVGTGKTASAVALFVSALILAGPIAQDHAEAAKKTKRVLLSASASGETRMLWLINDARRANDRVALRMNARLSRVAERHSQKMSNSNDLHHNQTLASEVSDMDWTILGENVGVGATIESLHKAFMHSPPHRRNVLNRRYRQVGIGVIVSNGRTWVTVVFYG